MSFSESTPWSWLLLDMQREKDTGHGKSSLKLEETTAKKSRRDPKIRKRQQETQSG